MPHQTAPEPATPKPAPPRRRGRPARRRRGRPARPNVVQRFFNRYPRSAAGLCAVALGYTTVLCSIHLAQAGRTVGSGYGLAVAAGLAFPVVLTAALILIWRARRKSGVLIFGVLGLGVLWFGCFIYASPAVYNHGFPLEVITSPVQAAALALTVMGAATVTLMTGLIIVRPPDTGFRGWRDPAPAGPQPGLITGLAGPRKNGWSVTWVCTGRVPAPVHAPSLSLAATGASATVASLLARGTIDPATEFQLAIYPWPYHGGPVFDITGAPGSLTARSGAASVHGATLEDLLTAGQRMPAGHGAMFRWTRPVSALPPAAQG
jgi:hypothetical protein